MYRLMMDMEHMQYEGQVIQCRIRLLEHKYMQKTLNSIARGTRSTQRDKQNSVSKIINEISLTFVLVYRKNEMFSLSVGEYLITVQMF